MNGCGRWFDDELYSPSFDGWVTKEEYEKTHCPVSENMTKFLECGKAPFYCPDCVAKLEADLKAYRVFFEATLAYMGSPNVEALRAIEQREGG